MKRVVITGVTGAVGMALLEECIKEKVEVLVLYHKNSKRAYDIPEHPMVTRMACDLSEMRTLDESNCLKYDVFFHLAWEGTKGKERDDIRLQLRNVEYTLDAVDLANRLGCHTFIGVGSQAEYGNVTEILSETTPVHPETAYGMAKLCAGQMSQKACKEKGIFPVWVRLLSVYGPFDREDSMVMYALRSLLKGEIPNFTQGKHKWDYLYSSDAAKALFLLGTKRKQNIYVLGSGNERPLIEYILQIKECVDTGLPLGIGKLPDGVGQVKRLCADISNINRDTGFVPETDFELGINRTKEWLLKREEEKR